MIALDPVELASEEDLEFWGRVRVDDTHAFFLRGSSELMRVPREGGPLELVLDHGASIVDFTQWGEDLYFVGYDGLFVVPKAGGEERMLASISSLRLSPGRLVAVDDEAVYVAEESSDDVGSIISVPHEGGSVKVLVEGLLSPNEIAIDADSVYVATVAELINLNEPPEGELRRVPKAGGDAQLLASINMNSLRVDDGGFVYGAAGAYSAVSPDSLFRVPKGGGAPERLDAEICDLAGAFVELVDGQVLYGDDSVLVADSDGAVQREYVGLTGIGSSVTSESRAFQGGVFFEIRDARRLLAFPQP